MGFLFFVRVDEIRVESLQEVVPRCMDSFALEMGTGASRRKEDDLGACMYIICAFEGRSRALLSMLKGGEGEALLDAGHLVTMLAQRDPVW
ncbi:hypothetical protein IE53DRAFT_388692 [Violaceomyces palustris]|uniref:Uncharacterized protein n=1 Tax=Violaceomyces palustris TaxID=1673888 RepID=A0ACD0NTJ1_9BASI|nr:hypothetical protein IE53DRAFT_388692 [Violaceomyces palustris]